MPVTIGNYIFKEGETVTLEEFLRLIQRYKTKTRIIEEGGLSLRMYKNMVSWPPYKKYFKCAVQWNRKLRRHEKILWLTEEGLKLIEG